MEQKRKILVVNKNFQYQHGLLIAVLAVLVVDLVVLVRLMRFWDEGYTLHLGYILLLLGGQLGLLYGVWKASLGITNRLAGPVYAIKREINRIGRGDLTARIVLRDKDRFLAEAAEMNSSIQTLQERVAAMKKIVGDLQAADLDSEGARSMLTQLQQELDHFSTG